MRCPSCSLDRHHRPFLQPGSLGNPAVHTGPAELQPPTLQTISPSEVASIQCLIVFSVCTLVSPWLPTLCLSDTTMPSRTAASSHLKSYCCDRCKALLLPYCRESPLLYQSPAGPRPLPSQLPLLKSLGPLLPTPALHVFQLLFQKPLRSPSQTHQTLLEFTALAITALGCDYTALL